MPIITKISTQKKAADRYNIYLDEKFAFGVDEEVLIRYQLRKGIELTEQEITQIQYEDEIRKALSSAINYLSFRMRSELEIHNHLRKKDWEEPVIQAVLSRLRELRYVDNLEFALAYVRTQVNGAKKGPTVIVRELKQKGISPEHIEIAMNEYTKESQIEHAIQMGGKLVNRNSRLSERFLKQRVEQTLMTKGFPFPIISIAMEEIVYEKDDEEEWQTLVVEGERAQRRYRKYTGYDYERRMKQALFGKGFPMELINRFLTEADES